MAYKYCCFVSYPHGQNDVLVPLIEKFVEALEKEIGAQIRNEIWLDRKLLKGGQILDAKVGSALCKSACMLMFYTPLYFDLEHLYCAQELQAMMDLETKRLQSLQEKDNSLIIPIILRGEQKFPLNKNKLYYKFTDIDFNNPVEQIPTKYAKEIRLIAEYIIERFDELAQVVDAPLDDCNTYSLPSEDEAKAFVESVTKKKMTSVEVPFVGRTN
jgi:hypothetical protein